MPSADRASLVEAEKLKGNEAFRASDYTSAIRHYQQALALSPSPHDWSLHTNLAIAHVRLERWEEALEWSDKAIEGSGGQWVKAWWRKALALEGLARLKEAVRAIDEAWQRSEGRLREEIGRDRERIQQAALQAHPIASPAGQAHPLAEEKEQLRFHPPHDAPPAPTPALSSLRRIPITADESDSDDSDSESSASMPAALIPSAATASHVPSLSTPSLPRARPFTSPSGMTIEVLQEEDDLSVPTSYPLFSRRLLALGEAGRARLMHGMTMAQWEKLLGPRCQLSSEALQAMVGVWRAGLGLRLRDVEEMEVVRRVERLGLIMQMVASLG